MFCQNCGNEVSNQSLFCSKCGAPQQAPTTMSSSAVNEENTWGWGVLGFFLPLVGLILFLVWKETKPKASKSSGMGALIGFVASFVIFLTILLFVLILAVSIAGVGAGAAATFPYWN